MWRLLNSMIQFPGLDSRNLRLLNASLHCSRPELRIRPQTPFAWRQAASGMLSLAKPQAEEEILTFLLSSPSAVSCPFFSRQLREETVLTLQLSCTTREISEHTARRSKCPLRHTQMPRTLLCPAVKTSFQSKQTHWKMQTSTRLSLILPQTMKPACAEWARNNSLSDIFVNSL